jgi:hypothetical protein
MIETPSERCERAKREMAAEVLQRFGELRFVARGLSMLPTILPGDVLTVRREPIEDARAGDVVLAARGGRFFAHRVVARARDHSGAMLITRGDALGENDLPMTADEWLGRVIEVSRNGRRLKFGIDRGMAKRALRGAVRRWDSAGKWLLRFHLVRGSFAERLRVRLVSLTAGEESA